jgi:hypothetical protein
MKTRLLKRLRREAFEYYYTYSTYHLAAGSIESPKQIQQNYILRRVAELKGKRKMKVKKQKLRKDYNNACNAYLRAFCEKNGYDYADAVQSWRGSDPGGVTIIAGQFVHMDDIITDIDMNAPKAEYIKYRSYCQRIGSIIGLNLKTPTYDVWLRGYPWMSEDKIKHLEELQRRVRVAELELKRAIDEGV